MKLRTTLAALATAAAFAAAAPGAHAITNGQADRGKHPGVGALVSYDPETGDKYLICSGTLISRSVFLTAAHCLVDEPSDLYVSFDEFVGAPDVGPGVKLHHGRAFGDPAFAGNTTGPEDTHDLAVVVLDQPIRRAKAAVLPPIGTLDRLERIADRIPWTVVGYGREGYDPVADAFFGGGGKRFGVGTWLELGDFTFKLSQDSEDEAGTCNGDSGGPIFVGRTRMLAGVSADGDELCQVDSINVRVDTRSARSFIKPFLEGNLPARPDTDAGAGQRSANGA